jgi:hypothetical protein
MFEENNSNFKLTTSQHEINDIERNFERNPLNLQPLYINEENLKK